MLTLPLLLLNTSRMRQNKVEDSIMLFKANKMNDKEGEGGLENI